jgi:hypothetical protein
MSELAPGGPMTPEERAENFALSFLGNANSLALFFGGPVYLVGSYLTSLHPSDIDVRLAMDFNDARAFFGEDVADIGNEWGKGRLARHRAQLKESRRMSRRFHKWGRIDFQIAFTTSTVIKDGVLEIVAELDLPFSNGKPFRRLDKIPDVFFETGRNEP